MKLLRQLPAAPNDGFSPFADEEIEQSITQRFEQQVRSGGERTAIRWDGGCYTYAALDATANQLAREILRRRGMAAEPVALLFQHGGEALAAILGVLKACKFYVVLDPGYPAERLRYMLEDSGAKLLIADAPNRNLARELCRNAIDVIGFDGVDHDVSGAPLGIYPAPESLALLLYTSGSTGRPKGVVHTHRNVLVDARNLANGWRVTQNDRWLLYASLSFANSVRTVYGSLLNGASVYPFDVKKEGFGALKAWMTDNAITVVRGVPTFFRSFMAGVSDDTSFPSVRILSLGGEPMLASDLGYFERHFSPGCVLSHAFGPTECLTVCWALVPHGTRAADGKLPIGYSLPDKDVLLLDESRREVADGSIGEIAVRSRYISPGYWRDAEQTRASFLPDPDGGDARIYVTGDLGMRAPDGGLIYVGRRDFQVKIRGFRVDVAEVENTLSAMPGISEAVVVGRELEPGEQRLLAYFVPSALPPVSAREIRAHLARALPDYMIPSVFIAMDAIPRTPNGKTDRLGLPPPGRNRPDGEGPLKVPGTPIEIELAAIWVEVLGIDRIGTDETFVDLGGDSLKAAMIAARVAARFALEVPASRLLAAGTVGDMAAEIAGAAPAPITTSLRQARG
jgi:amino acid adenylation domain-containing protein